MSRMIQNRDELKHLSLLRKALHSGAPMAIAFEGLDWQGTLHLAHGSIEGELGHLATLRCALTQPVLAFAWQPCAAPLHRPLDSAIAINRAMADWSVEGEPLQRLRRNLSQLPPIRLKAMAVFRLPLELRAKATRLYHLAMQPCGVVPLDYLAVADLAQQALRARILLFCWLTGALVPAAHPEQTTTIGSRADFARRIQARLNAAQMQRMAG